MVFADVHTIECHLAEKSPVFIRRLPAIVGTTLLIIRRVSTPSGRCGMLTDVVISAVNSDVFLYQQHTRPERLEHRLTLALTKELNKN